MTKGLLPPQRLQVLLLHHHFRQRLCRAAWCVFAAFQPAQARPLSESFERPWLLAGGRGTSTARTFGRRPGRGCLLPPRNRCAGSCRQTSSDSSSSEPLLHLGCNLAPLLMATSCEGSWAGVLEMELELELGRLLQPRRIPSAVMAVAMAVALAMVMVMMMRTSGFATRLMLMLAPVVLVLLLVVALPLGGMLLLMLRATPTRTATPSAAA